VLLAHPRRSSRAPAAPPSIAAGSKMTVRATGDGWVWLPRPRVRCPVPAAAACTVRAKARPAAGGAPVGTFSKTVVAGASATISFRLTKSARATLRRRGQLKMVVKIEARHGNALATRSVSVTITRR